jgi:hypothetical protein
MDKPTMMIFVIGIRYSRYYIRKKTSIMKKYHVLSFIALTIMFSCSKENINTDMDSLRSESSNLYSQNGVFHAKAPSIVTPIVFYSSSKEDEIFFLNACLPTGRKLLKNGSFNGNLKGFGNINPSLSPYEIVPPCEMLPIDPPNEGESFIYSVVLVGKVALSSRDYCKVTIRGNIYPGYLPSLGYDVGSFIGKAITESGAGKLKGLNNKIFDVYSGSPQGPTINLVTGTMVLRISETQ